MNKIGKLISICDDVLENGLNSQYVDNLSGIPEAVEILSTYGNMEVNVTYYNMSGHNTMAIHLMDDGVPYWTNYIYYETPSADIWYGMIKCMMVRADIHYNFPELFPYLSNYTYFETDRNMRFTDVGKKEVDRVMRNALKMYTGNVGVSMTKW